MRIGIAYSEPNQQIWLDLEVPETITVREAIERSGILRRCPQIDLETQKVGVFGKLARLDAPLKPGDRVEIHRPIIADPETVPRRDKGAEREVMALDQRRRDLLAVVPLHTTDCLNAYQTLVLNEPDLAVSQTLKEAFLALRQAAESGE